MALAQEAGRPPGGRALEGPRAMTGSSGRASGRSTTSPARRRAGPSCPPPASSRSIRPSALRGSGRGWKRCGSRLPSSGGTRTGSWAPRTSPSSRRRYPGGFQVHVPCAGHFDNGPHFLCMEEGAIEGIRLVEEAGRARVRPPRRRRGHASSSASPSKGRGSARTGAGGGASDRGRSRPIRATVVRGEPRLERGRHEAAETADVEGRPVRGR